MTLTNHYVDVLSIIFSYACSDSLLLTSLCCDDIHDVMPRVSALAGCDIDIEEDENEPELTYHYEEVDPLNPTPPASESEPDDKIKVEDAIESEDETVPASVHEIGESCTAPFLREDSDGLLPGLMRRDINSFFGRMASLSRRLCGRETAHALVEKKGKAKDKYYGKLILDLGNEVWCI
ncbi:hypothetical protein Tco_0678949 [Tanacetum coccineum]|uniref:Uncharacterized protein n=1 Tax=Tanacetum coccineum TaxID=301880 RepID=A0ABQ4XH74_9ASTR